MNIFFIAIFFSHFFFRMADHLSSATSATVTTGRRTRAQKTGHNGEHFRSNSPETVSTRFQGAIDRLAPTGTQAMSSGQTTAELVSAADHANSISDRDFLPGISSGEVSGTRV